MAGLQMLRRETMIRNARGLHARASAKLVKLAMSFDAAMTIGTAEETVAVTSVVDLLLLAAGPGTPVTLVASGRQAGEALDAAVALIERGFDEDLGELPSTA